MVDEQLAERGIRDLRVLSAMGEVPREAFVPPRVQRFASEDAALPIEEGQTISQPFIVALMAEALGLQPTDRVLEIGTGSGYGAAILSRLAAEVYSIERHEPLLRMAAVRLGALGFTNLHLRQGDGSLGWPEEAPFDAILVTAGAPEVPPALCEQLSPAGRLVLPVGDAPTRQILVRLRPQLDGSWRREELGDVRFVPLIGAEGWRE